MAHKLTIANNALAEIAAGSISSFDEASISGEQVSRLYPQVKAEMLTWTDWDFAIRRVTLALEANDRLGEWTYRYAAPADMAEAIRILPLVDTQVQGLPPIGPISFPAWDALGPIPFLRAGGSIYSNLESAVLEYQSSDVEEAVIDPLAARAMELELASRLAYPIKKDRSIKGDLIQQAQIARERAVAESENRNPRRQPDYISPVDYARNGSGFFGIGGRDGL